MSNVRAQCRTCGRVTRAAWITDGLCHDCRIYGVPRTEPRRNYVPDPTERDAPPAGCCAHLVNPEAGHLYGPDGCGCDSCTDTTVTEEAR